MLVWLGTFVWPDIKVVSGLKASRLLTLDCLIASGTIGKCTTAGSIAGTPDGNSIVHCMQCRSMLSDCKESSDHSGSTDVRGLNSQM